MVSKISKLLAVVTVLAGLAIVAGCTCIPSEPGQPAPAPAPKSACTSLPAPGMVSVQKAFPTGDPATSVILLEKVAPAEVIVGQAYDYELRVTNLTNYAIDSVVVSDEFSNNFTLESSDPQAKMSPQGEATWMVGSMQAKETKVIKVSGMAKGVGDISSCGKVAYRSNLCMNWVAVQPALKLEKIAPAEVLLCDVIPMRFIVTNTGTGIARNVKIMDTLPEGMTTLDGQKTLMFDACDLQAGESREFAATVKAAKNGKYDNQAVAKADGGLSANAAATTMVKQSVLAITKTAARDWQYAGRDISFEITVSNKGDAVAQNVAVVDVIPSNTSFVSATNGGSFANGQVGWTIPELKPGDSKKMGVTVKAVGIGQAVNSASASAVCADPVSAKAQTEIKGIAAILLEVIDVTDPIEVGENETYVITVTNQGSAPETNVTIVAELEAAQQYVSATGTTAAKAAGQKVTFAPVASLAAGAKAEWRLVVKAVKEGDIRMKVIMNGDRLERPVQETEATHQY